MQSYTKIPKRLKNAFWLIQPTFTSSTHQRNNELFECKDRNRFLTSELTSLRNFGQLFDLCKTDKINIVANSDIYFDETIYLAENIKPSEVYCLSRYDKGVLFDRRDSQDVWIFRGLPTFRPDFEMGKPGCDNRLAALFLENNYVVLNPSKTIKCHHLHESGVRTYTPLDRVCGPYHFIAPHELCAS